MTGYPFNLFLLSVCRLNQGQILTRAYCPIRKTKTHFPRVPFPLGCCFIHIKRGCALSPFTSILLKRSNSALKPLANSLISASVPGSWRTVTKHTRMFKITHPCPKKLKREKSKENVFLPVPQTGCRGRPVYVNLSQRRRRAFPLAECSSPWSYLI